MNPTMLPHRIKSDLDKMRAGESLAALRTPGALDGEPGEGYIVALPDRLAFFSRKAGEDVYSQSEALYGDGVTEAVVRDDKFNIHLDLTLKGSRRVSHRFSSFEKKDVALLTELVKSGGHGKGAVKASASTGAAASTGNEEKSKVKAKPQDKPAPPQDAPHPFVGMLAVLMCLSKADGVVAPEEDGFVRRVASDDIELLKAALAFQKGRSIHDLAASISGMSDDQKLCLIANMLDAAMADGAFRGNEQKLIHFFVERLGVSEENYQTIHDVIMIKNNLTVMTPEEA